MQKQTPPPPPKKKSKLKRKSVFSKLKKKITSSLSLQFLKHKCLFTNHQSLDSHRNLDTQSPNSHRDIGIQNLDTHINLSIYILQFIQPLHTSFLHLHVLFKFIAYFIVIICFIFVISHFNKTRKSRSRIIKTQRTKNRQRRRLFFISYNCIFEFSNHKEVCLSFKIRSLSR